MNLNRAGEQGDDVTQPTTGRTGIAGRVESAAKMKAPPPQGKSIAMMILGVVVLAALIYDFTTRGGPGKKVRQITEQQGKPVTAKTKPGEALQIAIEHEGEELTLSSAAAIAYFTSAPADSRDAIRPRIFKSLAEAEDLEGVRAQEAFELASRLLEGAGDGSADAIADLGLVGLPLLADDVAAPAVAFYLGSMPDGVDRTTARALDKVILDATRPIHVRVAAAEARPKDGRPEAIEALANAAGTHPRLRKALQ